jgi:calcineurin-like phosphoesterase family protein
MTTFFTSDTHFGHANIIKHCVRPFNSVGHMDDTIIANWNTVVGKKDTVWHLGDFTLHGEEEALRYAKLLNGTIHFIWGNHDRPAVRQLSRWASSQYAAEISLDGTRITLCHYGMRVWNHSHKGSLMLYGHSHGSLPGDNQSLDVGVDCWNWRPVTLPEIRKRLNTLISRVPVDHHGADPQS